MSETPFTDLSTEEQRRLLDECNRGERYIFAGERYTVPAYLNNNFRGLGSGYFEVSPEQLIDVAKHLEPSKGTSPSAIERAYSLICEAHVFSRNLKHWNEKSRRNHFSAFIHDLVKPHIIKTGTNMGKVPRIPLLQAFLKTRKLPSNKTDAGKIFNRWVKETLREKDFKNTIPWNPSRGDFDQNLNETLHKNEWIRWVKIGSGNFLVLPDESQRPNHKPRAKPKEGDHETRPWWTTKATWWPAPSRAEQKTFKDQYLCNKHQFFHSEYHAQKCLTSFKEWLQVKKGIEEKFGTRKKVQKVDPKTKRFR